MQLPHNGNSRMMMCFLTKLWMCRGNVNVQYWCAFTKHIRKTFLIVIGFRLISIKDMTVYGMTCLETTVNVICNYINNIEMKLNWIYATDRELFLPICLKFRFMKFFLIYMGKPQTHGLLHMEKIYIYIL